MKMKNLTPMLNVADVKRSIAFYAEVAGFEVTSDPETVESWHWAHITSGDCELMLSESGGPAPEINRADPLREEDGWPVIYYFHPDDVVSLHAELKEKGYPVGNLRVTFYGMKEFDLRDPDGHILWFGQDTEESPTEHE